METILGNCFNLNKETMLYREAPSAAASVLALGDGRVRMEVASVLSGAGGLLQAPLSPVQMHPPFTPRPFVV